MFSKNEDLGESTTIDVRPSQRADTFLDDPFGLLDVAHERLEHFRPESLRIYIVKTTVYNYKEDVE